MLGLSINILLLDVNIYECRVCYIASELMKTLKEDGTVNGIIESAKRASKKIDYEKCVKVAALCHDLGQL